MNYRVITLELINLPLVLATDCKGAIAGLTAMGCKKADAYVNAIAPTDAHGWVIDVCSPTGGTICILMVAKKGDWDTIAHEATHAAYKALDWAGIEHEVDNHEILAYTIGWIVGQYVLPWKKQAVKRLTKATACFD